MQSRNTIESQKSGNISSVTMFLLQCDDDDSLVICSESDVIFQNEVNKENEKELENLRKKIRNEKQNSKQQIGMSLSQQVISGKRNRMQNYKYKDYSMTSVSKCNTDTKQSMRNIKKSKCDKMSIAKKAKNTQISKLLHEDPTDKSSSTSSDEYYKHEFISQTQKKKRGKKFNTLENIPNSSRHEISNGSPKKEDLKKMLQEALTTIANLKNERASRTANIAQRDVTPNKHVMNVTAPFKISNEAASCSRYNCMEEFSQQNDVPYITSTPEAISDLEIFGDSNTEIRNISPSNENSESNVNTPERNELQSLISDPGKENRQLQQLYGKDWSDDTMVLLRDEVYCRRSVLCEALGASSKASHLVRRLVLGVFKKDAMYNVTLTGKPPRAAGRQQNASQQLLPLDDKAKIAIIKFAQSIAKKKNWRRQSKKSLSSVMTQRIGEIKRDMKHAAAS